MTAQQRNRTRPDARPLRERRRAAQERRPPRSVWVIAGACAAVALVAFVYFYFAPLQAASASLPSGAELASVQQAITRVDPAIFDAVGTGDLQNPIKAMNPTTPRLGGVDGRAHILFIGAEYCSYCASERWSLVAALSRFGEFKILNPTKSASGESYPELATFTFYRGQYDSPYVNLIAIETGDRSKRQLQRLSQDQQSLMTLYNRVGTIPFISYGNRYYSVGTGYEMKLIVDKSWSDIAGVLRDPTNPLTRAIIGNANYITAGICRVTEGQPVDVCASPGVTAADAKLPR